VASRFGFRAHARRGVGAEVGMLDLAEGVGVFLADVGLDAAEGEVHNGEAARSWTRKKRGFQSGNFLRVSERC